MPTPAEPTASDALLSLRELLPALREHASSALRSTTDLTVGVARIVRMVLPLIDLINAKKDITEPELHAALNDLFESITNHPLVGQLGTITARMRDLRWLPNEQSTEDLLKFLVEQVHKRSVVPIPKEVSDQFWQFFDELMQEPELRGLADVSLEVLRILLTAYEPLIVKVINQLKALKRANDAKLSDIADSVAVIRDDLAIFKRQIRALRHVRLFFDTDPKDFKGQAEVMAQMVREFGPLFIKMAQVAAANADFLPQEMSEALAVFREDVDPMTPEEVEQAFMECFGELPDKRYFGFDASKPLKSGSIASVYLAQKPMKATRRGERRLSPVVVKVGRHNLAREFLIGKTVIKLAIVSSHYWAPHSKIAPFFNSWVSQIDEFVEGFNRELDFEMEAENQARFAGRTRPLGEWRVPKVYARTRRIIEMEYIDDAINLQSAFAPYSVLRNERTQRRIGRAFLQSVMSQMLVHREFHGDLHPGNVLVRNADHLYFIDWGNTVALEPLWRPALHYVRAVMSGNVDLVTDSVIRMCVDPQAMESKRDDIAIAVEKAFDAANVTPLSFDFAYTLYQEGQEGLIGRLELAVRLASSMSRQGVIIQGDYMHLSRSIAAMIGSYASIYVGLPRTTMLKDAAEVLLGFPLHMTRLFAFNKRVSLLRRLRQKIPIVGASYL